MKRLLFTGLKTKNGRGNRKDNVSGKETWEIALTYWQLGYVTTLTYKNNWSQQKSFTFSQGTFLSIDVNFEKI